MSRLKTILPILFALVLFCVSIWAIQKELSHYSLGMMIHHWHRLPKSHKIGAIALTAIGYFVMTGYDFLAFRYLRRLLSFGKIASTAFISYAVGNTVGFSAFSGTAIRYRFYGSWGISKVELAKLIVFTHIIFWLALFAISGLVFVIDPLTIPSILSLPFASLHPIGYLFLIGVAIYFGIIAFGRKNWKIGQEEVVLPSINISLAAIVLSFIDWGIASEVLYLLFPHHSSLTHLGFFGIYILALTAGLISTVPGGLGVFETVILTLRPSDLPSSDVLAALIAYRGIYYFLPLLVALVLFLVQSWVHRRVS